MGGHDQSDLLFRDRSRDVAVVAANRRESAKVGIPRSGIQGTEWSVTTVPGG